MVLIGFAGCTRHDERVEQPLPVVVDVVVPASGVVGEPPPVVHATTETPSGYERMSLGGVMPAPEGSAVVLVDARGERAVPIFIGGAEATSIQLRLEQRAFRRPLTHDLVDSLLRRLGGQVLSVRVDRVEEDVFYGTLVVQQGETAVEFDSRPSDAIALAVGCGAPIFVAEQVLQQAGMRLDQLDREEPAPRADELAKFTTISL